MALLVLLNLLSGALYLTILFCKNSKSQNKSSCWTYNQVVLLVMEMLLLLQLQHHKLLLLHHK